MLAEPHPVPAIRTQTFLNVPFACLDVAGAARLIGARPFGTPFSYVVTSNASHLVRLNRLKDARFADAIAGAGLNTLDGSVPHWLAHKVFGLDIPLCPGSDLTIELFAHVIRPDDPITIIGGSQEMRARLAARYGLSTIHLHVPPMGFIDDPAAVEAAISFVEEHPARYVFLVVGAPRSEYLAAMIAARWEPACAWAARSISSPASCSGPALPSGGSGSNGSTAWCRAPARISSGSSWIRCPSSGWRRRRSSIRPPLA